MKIVFLTILIILLHASASPTSERNQANICKTDNCQETADYLIASRDVNVDPCENFYNYACGGYVQKNIGKSIIDTVANNMRRLLQETLDDLLIDADLRDSKTMNLTAQVYKNCLNSGLESEEELLKDIRKIIKDLGGWPIIDPRWSEEKFDLYKTMAYVQRQFKLKLGITFSISVDVTNPSRKIINLQTPFSKETFLPGLKTSKAMSKEQSQDEDIFNIAKRIVVVKNVACWINPNCTRNEAFDIDASMTISLQQTMDVITAIGGYRGDSENSNDFDIKTLTNFVQRKPFPHKKKPPMNTNHVSYSSIIEEAIIDNPGDYFKKIKDVQIDLDEADFKFNVLTYLNDVLADSGENVTEEDTIFIVKDSLQTIVMTLENPEIDRRQWANFFVFAAISPMLNVLSERYRTWAFDAEKDKETDMKPSNSFYCVEYMKLLMPYSVGRLVADFHFPKEKKDAAENMIGNLRSATKDMLDNALKTWLDPITHKEAVEKLANMQESVAYPEWTLRNDALDYYYDIDEKNVSGPADLLRKIASRAFDFTVKGLRRPVDRKMEGWQFMSAAEVNAFYYPPINIIVFPGGFLNFPVFELDRPKVLNYGGIGWIIGHEITHGFDDSGRRFDAHGTIRDWWTPETSSRFTELAECFIDQYGNITDQDTGEKISGHSTLGENIADNGGLREAFQAYKKVSTDERLPGLEDMSQDQLFFLSAANMWCSRPDPEASSGIHSPDRYRVLVTMSNSDDFAKAFNCPIGSPMNPEKKCVLW